MNRATLSGAPSGKAMIRCPNCAYPLVDVDLPRTEAGPPSEAPGSPMLLRISEAVELLSISRSSLLQLIAAGDVPVVRLGRMVRVPRRGLDNLVER